MGETKEVRLAVTVQTVQNTDKSLGKTSAATKFHQPKRATNYLFSNKIIIPLAWIRVGACQLATLHILPPPFSISSKSRQFLSFCFRSQSRVFFLQSIVSSDRTCIHHHLETYNRILGRTVYLHHGRLDLIAVILDRQLYRCGAQRCIRIVLRAKSGAGLAQPRHSR